MPDNRDTVRALTDRIAAQDEEIFRLRQDLADERHRARLIVSRDGRITKLLRNTLPDSKQEGWGVDGMLTSLLAYLVGLQRRVAYLEKGYEVDKDW